MFSMFYAVLNPLLTNQFLKNCSEYLKSAYKFLNYLKIKNN